MEYRTRFKLFHQAKIFSSLKIQTSLDPGFRRDDDFGANSFSNVIPVKAGAHCLSLQRQWLSFLGPTASQTSSRRRPGSSVFRCKTNDFQFTQMTALTPDATAPLPSHLPTVITLKTAAIRQAELANHAQHTRHALRHRSRRT